MYIEVVAPGATDTARTIWRFRLITSYGNVPPKLDVDAKKVQARKSRRHKWIDDPSRGYYPDDWRNRGKTPPEAPIEIARLAVEQITRTLLEVIEVRELS